MVTYMIKHVIFDLDETLVQWSPRYVDYLLYTIEKVQPLSTSQKRIIEHDIHEFWVDLPHIHEELSINKNVESYICKFVYPILIKNGICFEKQKLVKMFTSFDETYSPIHNLYDDVLPALIKMKEIGIRTSILTNRRLSIDEKREIDEISKSIHKIFIAGEIGYWKPDIRIFKYVLNQLDTNPNECVYIGDNFFVDVAGSQKAGMHTILLDRKEIYPTNIYKYILKDLNNIGKMLAIL